jgi:hypothetical protein
MGCLSYASGRIGFELSLLQQGRHHPGFICMIEGIQPLAGSMGGWPDLPEKLESRLFTQDFDSVLRLCAKPNDLWMRLPGTQRAGHSLLPA